MVLNVDDAIPAEALDELKGIAGIETAFVVSLPQTSPNARYSPSASVRVTEPGPAGSRSASCARARSASTKTSLAICTAWPAPGTSTRRARSILFASSAVTRRSAGWLRPPV